MTNNPDPSAYEADRMQLFAAAKLDIATKAQRAELRKGLRALLAENARLRECVRKDGEALVESVIPLEAMSIGGRASDFSPELQRGVSDAISAIRARLADREVG